MTPFDAPFVGWFREVGKGHRWKPVSYGATEAEAFRKLLAYHEDGVTNSEVITLPRGRKP